MSAAAQSSASTGTRRRSLPLAGKLRGLADPAAAPSTLASRSGPGALRAFAMLGALATLCVFAALSVFAALGLTPLAGASAGISLPWLLFPGLLCGYLAWEAVHSRRASASARQAAEAAAAECEASKARFLDSIGHEFRTPLNAVIEFAEIMANDSSRPMHARHREYLSLIRSHGTHMLQLVDDCQQLARGGDCMRGWGEPQDIWAAPLLFEVKRALAPLAKDRAVRLAGATPWPGPPMRADAAGLRRVLLQVADNAVRHSPSGSGVMLTAQLIGGTWRLSIEDEGPGLTPEQQSAIFDPLGRFADAAGRRRDTAGSLQGVGLGLTLVQGTLRRMNCTLDILSEAGRGTRVDIYVPAKAPRHAGPAAEDEFVMAERLALAG